MKTIMVCIKHRFGANPSCGARGGEALAAMLESGIAEQGLAVQVHRFACLGLCELGPNMKVVGGDMFHRVGRDDLPAILHAAAQGD